MSSLDSVSPTVVSMRVSPQQGLQLQAENIARDIKQGALNSFQRVIDVSSADPHKAGIKSLPFIRQVLAACLCPHLLKDKSLAQDVRQRAQTLLEACDGGSVGAYTPSAGLTYVRRSIAEFITKRDGGVPSHSNNILISAGSHHGLMTLLKVLSRGKGKTRTGVLTPVPCPSTLPVLLDDVDVKMVPYQLTEERGWAVEVEELQRALTAARGHCEPRAIYISNPGNPTGHVQDRTSMEDVIQFAADHQLLILANEMDQDCVFGPDSEFVSYKKVLMEMDQQVAESVQLVSFNSVSNGLLGEGGLRAGYMETINIDPEVIHFIEILLCFDISTPVMGQLALDLMVNPPKPGDQSYDTYTQEVLQRRKTLSQNAQRVAQVLNSLPGMSCQPSMGGVYLCPSLHLPSQFITYAKVSKMEADVLYCQMLLQEEGVLLGPGWIYGGASSKHHLRLCILVPAETVEDVLSRISAFQRRLMDRFTTSVVDVKSKDGVFQYKTAKVFKHEGVLVNGSSLFG